MEVPEKIENGDSLVDICTERRLRLFFSLQIPVLNARMHGEEMRFCRMNRRD